MNTKLTKTESFILSNEDLTWDVLAERLGITPGAAQRAADSLHKKQDYAKRQAQADLLIESGMRFVDWRSGKLNTYYDKAIRPSSKEDGKWLLYSHLNKDGSTSQKHRPTSGVNFLKRHDSSYSLPGFVTLDTMREANADIVRGRIADLEAQLDQARQDLKAVYHRPGAETVKARVYSYTNDKGDLVWTAVAEDMHMDGKSFKAEGFGGMASAMTSLHERLQALMPGIEVTVEWVNKD